MHSVDYQPGSAADFERLYKDSYWKIVATLTGVRGGDQAAAEDCAAGVVTVLATDGPDPSIQLVIRGAHPTEPSPVLAVLHDGKLGCVAPATTADVIIAHCGTTQMRLRLEGPPWDSSGWLWVGPTP